MPRDEALNRRAHALIRPVPRARASFDVLFGGVGALEAQIASLDRDWGLNLAPDFQRGHVWTDEQRRAFVEGIFEETVTSAQKVIQFNCPHWDRTPAPGTSDLPEEIQIVDGLQRLTALRMFMAGQIHPFGLTYDELIQTDFSPKSPRYSVKFAVHTFQTREQLLEFYLRINAGGTPHSQHELERVAGLLEEARGSTGPRPLADRLS
jgi:hypothetical protein